MIRPYRGPWRLDFSTSPPTLLIWSGTAWVGPVGPAGAPGATGATGATGPAGASGTGLVYLEYQHQAALGAAGGTFTSGAWRTRTLTTEVWDTGNHGVLAANQVTLDPGTYQVEAFASNYFVQRNQMRIQDVTNAVTLALGHVQYEPHTGDPPCLVNVVAGRFTLASAAAIEVQHQCQTTEATDGFGLAGNFGTEVYCTLKLWKE